MRYFIAGCLPFTDLLLTLPRPKYILETFYQLRKVNDDKVKKLFTLIDFDMSRFILDSGAFTLMKDKSKTIVDIENYIIEYINFVKKWNIINFIEMDLDRIFPFEQVKKWKETIDNGVGRRSMPVYHDNRGIDWLHKTAEEYDYICTGTDKTEKDYKKMRMIQDIAHSHNCKIHGLGFSNNQLSTFRFDSVDATNWLLGSQFGILVRFNRNHLDKIQQPKNTKRKHHSIYNAFCFNEYVKYQHYLDTL